MKERFDFICSFGSTCLGAMSLRDAGLRLASFPFDWMRGIPFAKRAELVANDFAGWFEAKDLEYLELKEKHVHDSYRNRATGAVFPHDFPHGVPFEEAYPEARGKYDRRIARLYDCVRRSKRVLFVWVECPMEKDSPADAEVVAARALLLAKFPGVDIEFLVIDRAPDDEATAAPVRGDGFWRISCGFRKTAEQGPDGKGRPWDMDTAPILKVLTGFEAVDHRTREERRRHEAERRRKKYAELGAKSALGFVFAKLGVKLCKRVMNRLRRRGVDLAAVFEAQLRKD